MEEGPREARRYSRSCPSLSWSPTALLGVTRLPLPLLENFWMKSESSRRGEGAGAGELGGGQALCSSVPHGLGASASPRPHFVLPPSAPRARPSECPCTTLWCRRLAPWHGVVSPVQGGPPAPRVCTGRGGQRWAASTVCSFPSVRRSLLSPMSQGSAQLPLKLTEASPWTDPAGPPMVTGVTSVALALLLAALLMQLAPAPTTVFLTPKPTWLQTGLCRNGCGKTAWWAVSPWAAILPGSEPYETRTQDVSGEQRSTGRETPGSPEDALCPLLLECPACERCRWDLLSQVLGGRLCSVLAESPAALLANDSPKGRTGP